MPDQASFRRRLLRWYDQSKRELPWRETSDPWRILVSEIMLQQTRVATAIPYYHRFLERFPIPQDLAAAPEEEVLAAWSGLGYYSRARNLQKAAVAIGDRFPREYETIRALPGVGAYTAAAVGSIAFGLPYPAVDGNVLRVISRLTCDPGDIASPATRDRFTAIAGELLERRSAGDFNQAMMELGATVCLPRQPLCLVCPVVRNCAARREGREDELPVKRSNPPSQSASLEVLVVEHAGKILFTQRPASEKRMPGFWELPDRQLLRAADGVAKVGSFRHTIVNTAFHVQVFYSAESISEESGMRWIHRDALQSFPLTTISRKAIKLADRSGSTPLTPSGSTTSSSTGQ